MSKKTKSPPSKAPRFAELLRAARDEANWSLREVEKRTGNALSRQTVLRAEQGDAELETVLKLVKVYGMSAKARDSIIEAFNEHVLKKAKAALAA